MFVIVVGFSGVFFCCCCFCGFAFVVLFVFLWGGCLRFWGFFWKIFSVVSVLGLFLWSARCFFVVCLFFFFCFTVVGILFVFDALGVFGFVTGCFLVWSLRCGFGYVSGGAVFFIVMRIGVFWGCLFILFCCVFWYGFWSVGIWVFALASWGGLSFWFFLTGCSLLWGALSFCFFFLDFVVFLFVVVCLLC